MLRASRVAKYCESVANDGKHSLQNSVLWRNDLGSACAIESVEDLHPGSPSRARNV